MSEAKSSTSTSRHNISHKAAKDSKDSETEQLDSKELKDLNVEEQDIDTNSAKLSGEHKASVGWNEESTGAPAIISSTASDAEPTRRAGRRSGGTSGSGNTNADGKVAKNKYFDDDGDAVDLADIPDLDEEEREPDITTKIAEAPRNVTRSVQSMKELDKNIKFSLPTIAAPGVDLHILTNTLCPERAVIEEDEIWTYDSLVNDVSQEFQKDLDEKDEIGTIAQMTIGAT